MPEIFVSIGSCLQRRENVQAALKTLRKRFGRIHYSSVYETEALGFKGDPFFNLVVSFNSSLDTHCLRRFFRSVEHQQGRNRCVEMPGPCSLDLDLLLYGDFIVETKDFKLPREDVLKCAYVLEPLSELAPDHYYPGTATCYRELWAAFDGRHSSGSIRIAWDPLKVPFHSRSWCFPDYTMAIQS